MEEHIEIKVEPIWYEESDMNGGDPHKPTREEMEIGLPAEAKTEDNIDQSLSVCVPLSCTNEAPIEMHTVKQERERDTQTICPDFGFVDVKVCQTPDNDATSVARIRIKQEVESDVKEDFPDCRGGTQIFGFVAPKVSRGLLVKTPPKNEQEMDPLGCSGHIGAVSLADTFKREAESTGLQDVSPSSGLCLGGDEEGNRKTPLALHSVQDLALSNSACQPPVESIEKADLSKENSSNTSEKKSEPLDTEGRDGVPVPSKKSSSKSVTCDMCCKDFSNKRTLRNHMHIHTGTHTCVCPICNVKFAQATYLRRHQTTHTGLKPYTCNVCDAKFSQCSALSRHKKRHMEGLAPRFVCSVCDAKFKWNTALVTHMRIHTGEKPYACNECEARFTQPGSLTIHKRTHSGERPYACQICDARFSTGAHLVRHRRTHTDETPYACTICDVRLTSYSRLVTHRKTHSNEKPFACTMCDAKFAGRVTLVAHIGSHLGERPYACDHCEAKFTCKSYVNQHIRRSHGGKKPSHTIKSLDTTTNQDHNKIVP